MTRAAIVALVIAGCLARPSAIPDSAGGGGGGGDGGRGAGPDSMPVPNCPLAVIDNFDDIAMAPCGTGSLTGSAALDSGQLVLEPVIAAGSNGFAGCAWADEPSGGGGIAVEIFDVLTQHANDSTALVVTTSDGFIVWMSVLSTPAPVLTMNDNAGDTLASIPFDRATQTWWRIRAVDEHTFTGEYAVDPPVVWHALDTTPSTVSSTLGPVTVELQALSFSQGAYAYFDNVEACTTP